MTPATGQGPERVEARVRKRDPQQRQHRGAAEQTDDQSDGHLDGELLDDDPERSAVLRRELDHPDHQRDSDGIVDAGLTLEDRPGAAADLLVPQHGEHHRRIGRCQRGAEDPGDRPREVEEVVSCHRDDPGRREGAEDPQREDRPGGDPEAAPADERPAVEEDDDQRDDADALDLENREALPEPGEDVGGDGRQQEEDHRLGNWEPLADLGQEQGEQEPARHDEHDGSEDGELVHETSLNGGRDNGFLTDR